MCNNKNIKVNGNVLGVVERLGIIVHNIYSIKLNTMKSYIKFIYTTAEIK